MCPVGCRSNDLPLLRAGMRDTLIHHFFGIQWWIAYSPVLRERELPLHNPNILLMTMIKCEKDNARIRPDAAYILHLVTFHTVISLLFKNQQKGSLDFVSLCFYSGIGSPFF